MRSGARRNTTSTDPAASQVTRPSFGARTSDRLCAVHGLAMDALWGVVDRHARARAFKRTRGLPRVDGDKRACARGARRYLRLQPRLGSAPLFPNLKREGEAISKKGADHLLRRAETVAKLAKFDRGLWHPYRRAWASTRKHLPDVDVSRAG